MSTDGSVNRNLAVVRGNVERGLVIGIEARRKIDRELHRVVCSVPTSQQHADWHYDLRRKRLQAWGAMLRLIDVLVMAGAPVETVLSVPDALRAYALDQLAARDGIASDDTTPKRAA